MKKIEFHDILYFFKHKILQVFLLFSHKAKPKIKKKSVERYFVLVPLLEKRGSFCPPRQYPNILCPMYTGKHHL